MRYESFHHHIHPGTERLSAAQTPQEALREYETLAKRAVAEHERTLDQVSADYQDTFTAEARRPGANDIDGTLSQTGGKLEEATRHTDRSVQDIVGAASRFIPSMLSEGDQSVLRDAEDKLKYSFASDFSKRSRELNDILSGASNPWAIKAVLDNELLGQLRDTVRYGADGRHTQTKLQWLLGELPVPKCGGLC